MSGNSKGKTVIGPEATEFQPVGTPVVRQLTNIERIALATTMNEVEQAKQRYAAVMREIGLDPATAYTLGQDGTVRVA